MKSPNKFFWAKILVSVVGMIALCIAHIWGICVYPYKVFPIQETQTISAFDVLNERTFEELPENPDGTELIHKGSGGISSP
jgi:hypothetical protein